MSTKQHRHVDIEDGPSREDLFDALKYGPSHKFVVRFSGRDIITRHAEDAAGQASEQCFVGEIHSCTATVLGIAHKDESGHRFVIKARLAVSDQPVKIYYDVMTRRGFFSLSTP